MKPLIPDNLTPNKGYTLRWRDKLDGSTHEYTGIYLGVKKNSRGELLMHFMDTQYDNIYWSIDDEAVIIE
jgi:hypothetical protein